MEDVTSLTKEEFLKFLNCSHHSTQPERIVVAGPKNRKIHVVKRFGRYSAGDVQLDEFSLNRQILRIPLPKVVLEGLSLKQAALRFKTQKSEKKRKSNNAIVSRFGRKIKKKQLNIQALTKTHTPSKNPVTYSKKVDLPRSYQKINKPPIIQKTIVKPKQEIDKPSPKKMATWTPSFNQAQGSDQISPVKPRFIIKYVPSEPTYFLKMAPQRYPSDGKLKYAFDTLVKDIKNMKLPSPTWKIKVVVKSNKIASIIFTNKCVLERTVSFNAKSEFFEVVIENRPAILLGSPNTLSCVEDIEILLNIIHTISAKNPMVYYKN